MTGAMIRIVCDLPASKDATSYYRAMFPLSKLQRGNPGLIVDFNPDMQSMELAKFDIMFLQRPVTAGALRAIALAHQQNLKVWADFDDNFFDVPTDNPGYAYYSKQENMDLLKKILSELDLVTVTNDFLRSKYALFCKKIKVIPNAIDTDMCKTDQYLDPGKLTRRKTIVWRGSATHTRDVYTVKDQMKNVAKKFPQWHWVFIGQQFWFLHEVIPHERVTYMKGINPVFGYLAEIQRLGAGIFIAPLDFSDFNRAKSNIVWLEATWAGAVCLSANTGQFPKEYCLTYNTPDEFESKLISVMDGTVNTAKLHAKAWAHIKASCTLREANELRARAIKELVGVK